MGNLRNVGPTPSSQDAVPTKAQVDAKYTKPGGGIPETDLTTEVQTKLNATPTVSDADATTKGIMLLPGFGFAGPPDPADPFKPFYQYSLLGGTADNPNIYYVAVLVKAFNEWVTGNFQIDESVPGVTSWYVKYDGLDAAIKASLALADNSVQKTGDQTIQGAKTFQGTVNVPTATAGPHAVNKNTMDAALTGKVKNASGQSLTLWTGTQAAYNAIATKDNNTIYVVTT